MKIEEWAKANPDRPLKEFLTPEKIKELNARPRCENCASFKFLVADEWFKVSGLEKRDICEACLHEENGTDEEPSFVDVPEVYAGRGE